MNVTFLQNPELFLRIVDSPEKDEIVIGEYEEKAMLLLSFALVLTSAHKLVIIGITFTANTQREVRLRGEKIR